MIALNEEQRKYAEDHHDLVDRFLRGNKLNRDEYYDTVVFGYLRAVQRYLTEAHLQQFAFSTIAWWAMRSNLYNKYRHNYRPKRYPMALSLDDYDTNSDRPYISYVIDTDASTTEEDVVNKMMWLEIAATLTRPQRMLVVNRARGVSDAELAKMFSMSPEMVGSAFDRIRNKVNAILRYDG